MLETSTKKKDDDQGGCNAAVLARRRVALTVVAALLTVSGNALPNPLTFVAKAVGQLFPSVSGSAERADAGRSGTQPTTWSASVRFEVRIEWPSATPVGGH